jgi:hypothetical protein
MQFDIKYCGVVVLCVALLLVSCGGDAPRSRSDSGGTPVATRPSEPGTSKELTDLLVVPVASGLNVTETGAVEIHVSNADDLYGLHLTLKFDPSLLRVQDLAPEQQGVQIAPGALPAPDFTVRNQADNEQGVIEYAVTQLNPREPAHGDGVVAVIQFQGVNSGVSALTLLYAKLSNPDGLEMPVQVVDATLRIN